MKIERTARVGDRRQGCRHVACQTNLGGGSLMAAQKMSQRGGTPMQQRPGSHHHLANTPAQQNRPLNHVNNNNVNNSGVNKRSQEVVDLTDEDNSAPAVKRSNSGVGFGAASTQHHPPYGGGGVATAAGPHSAALQQLVASG